MSETTPEGHRIRTREKHLGLVLIESLRQFASLEDVKNLLRQGAVVNMRDPVTRESVRLTITHSHLLQSNPYTLSHKIKSQALHVAARRSTVSVCETLIEFKADVHSVDREGKTPLHMASMRGSGVLVRLLLKHGADANAKDKKDLTPADVVKSDSGAESVFGNTRKYRGSIYGPPTDQG